MAHNNATGTANMITDFFFTFFLFPLPWHICEIFIFYFISPLLGLVLNFFFKYLYPSYAYFLAPKSGHP